MDNTKSDVFNIDLLLKRAAVKFGLLAYDNFIADKKIQPITSATIFEANSKTFHPDGLFSEQIFGTITSLERFTTFGYINLNARLIHPIIYAEIIARRKLYTGIMAGNKLCRWDNSIHDFVLADESDKKADTGYSFFISHFPKIAKKEATSVKAKTKLTLLEKYKDSIFVSKYLVLPAGLRDIKLTTARLAQDDINKSYLALVSLTSALTDHSLSEDKVFDGIKYNIQLKLHEVFQHIYTMMKGKGGFLQGHYAKRKVVYSTRNVASVMLVKGDDPTDPTMLSVNDAAVPLLNTIKAFQPFFVKFIKRDLYGEVLTKEGLENVPLTDTTTFETKYVEVKPAELRKYTDSKEIDRIINRFKHVGFRSSPVGMIDSKGTQYCLLVVYIDGTDIYIGKNKDELQQLVEGNNGSFVLDKVRPLSWAEAMYIAALYITKGKHVLIARYPITGEESMFLSKVVPMSTIKTINGKIHFNGVAVKEALRYPIDGEIYTESISVSSSRLRGLGADFDGDMLNCIGLWSEEANKEAADHLSSIYNVVDANFKLNFDTTSDITKLVLHNLSV